MTKQTAQNRSAPARGGRASDHGVSWAVVVSKSGRTMTLADPEMAQSVKQFEKTVTASKDSALDFLRRAGIATPTGRLKKVYGG
jgi:hypothetical protein